MYPTPNMWAAAKPAPVSNCHASITPVTFYAQGPVPVEHHWQGDTNVVVNISGMPGAPDLAPVLRLILNAEAASALLSALGDALYGAPDGPDDEPEQVA